MTSIKKRKVRLPVRSKKQALQLVSDKRLFATLLGTGGLLNYVSASMATGDVSSMDETMVPVDNSEDCAPTHEECVEIEVATEAIMTVESSTFSEAFASARASMGAGGVFEYNGELYNTYYKEEWEAMTDTEKDQFFAHIDQAADYSEANYIAHDNAVTKISIDHDPEPEVVLTDLDQNGLIDEIEIKTESGTVTLSQEQLGQHQELDISTLPPASDMLIEDDSLDYLLEGDLDVTVGGFSDVDDVPDPEVVEVEVEDMAVEDIEVQEDDMMGYEEAEITVDERDITQSADVVEVSNDDLVDEDLSMDEVLDDYFEDDLFEPDVDADAHGAEDLPDPISDADLDDWDF